MESDVVMDGESAETSAPGELKALQRTLAYSFRNRNLLEQALTHRSYANEVSLGSLPNERLEFLGDAVLQLVISSTLVERFPESEEGVLSKVRASLVGAKHLAQIGEQLNLASLLKVGKSLRRDSNRKHSAIVADAVEAVVGAIFLDSDFEQVRRVVLGLFSGALEKVSVSGLELFRDHKSSLQEVCIKEFGSWPEYKLVEEIGPPHERIFVMSVSILGRCIAEAQGRSKKTASGRAAAKALDLLLNESKGRKATGDCE